MVQQGQGNILVHSFPMMIQERVDAWGRINKMALDNPLVSDVCLIVCG